MKHLKILWERILNIFLDTEDPNQPVYDPVHFGAMIVIVIFSIGVLFWLLWTLLVFEGGLSRKIVPAFMVLFRQKTLNDYGWIGYPYEMGIFEGLISNLIALLLTIALVVAVWFVVENQARKNKD